MLDQVYPAGLQSVERTYTEAGEEFEEEGVSKCYDLTATCCFHCLVLCRVRGRGFGNKRVTLSLEKGEEGRLLKTFCLCFSPFYCTCKWQCIKSVFPRLSLFCP